MAGASNIRAGKAFVELSTRDKLSRGLKRAQRRLRAFGAGVTAIGRQMTASGLAGAAGFAIAIRSFAHFDDKMREVRAVTSATEDQFESLRAEARRLGATTSFTATQVAGAMAELGRAGFDSSQILESTEGVLSLAKATSTELPRAAEIAGAALRAFNLDVSQTGRVSDVLTAGTNKSAQTLEDLFEAFKPVAPIASEANESIEAVTASIGILANNGIKGSLAGTALARAYKNLATEASQTDLRSMGADAVDAAGNLRPMADIMNDLAQATANLPTAKKLAAFESLFGRGQAAALKLAGSAQAFAALRTEIEDSAGLAVKTAGEMEAGIGGSFRRLLSAVESVMISVGKAIEGPLKAASEAALKAAGWIDSVVQKNPGLVKAIALTTAGLLAGGLALFVVGAAAGTAGIVLGGLATIIGAVGTVAGVAGAVLAAMLSPIGLVTAASIAMGTAIVQYSGAGGAALEWLGNQFASLLGRWRPVVEAIRGSLVDGGIGAAAKVLWAALKVEWEQGTLAIKIIWAGMKASFLTIMSEMWHGVQAGFATGIHAIETAWIKSFAFLGNIFDRFVGGVKKTWDGVKTTLAKGAIDLNPTLTDERKAVLKGLLDKGHRSSAEDIDAGTKKAIAERNARRDEKQARADERHQKVLEGIVDDANTAATDIENTAADSITTAVDDLVTAREELDAAIATASGDGGEPGSAGGGLSESIDEMLGKIAGAMGGLGDRSGLSSKGTFSGAAAADLGNRKLETLVSVSERIADNTARMVRQNESNGMTFS